MHHNANNPTPVSAIVPARNEEALIEACVRSLMQQPEIAEVLVVDDQSTDATAAIARRLAGESPKVRLLEAADLPAGWVGKNNAAWIGAKAARGEWLLFTDADTVHGSDSAARGLAIAGEDVADLVSFSPEQVLCSWHEKAAIPYVFLRLGSRFPFDEINDPESPAAAANGQFMLIRREAYEAVGGHASVAGNVLEDVALAERVKSSGRRIWFGSGKGIVRVRMYRSFAAMWEGWKKNLYLLMGGTPESVKDEISRALTPMTVTLVSAIGAGVLARSGVLAAALLAAGLAGLLTAYALELARNDFLANLAIYGIPGRILFAAVLWASYRSHRNGRLEWKGRAYPARTPGASKG